MAENSDCQRPQRCDYDVIVVGSGGAGAAAAQAAASHGARVLVVSKDPMVCSDSKIAEGIVTVRGSGSDADTEKELSTNLRLGGDDINDPDLTAAFAQDSVAAYSWLREHGIKPELEPATGRPVGLPTAMGGHSRARSIDHPNGGLDYAHACWSALTQHEGIDYLEDAWFLDAYKIVRANGTSQVVGGLVYHAASGQFISIKAAAVVLACGGLSTLYFPHTDTMRGNTGDAYAIAARAGAQLVDMEQIQFIPFAIAKPGSYEGLVVGEPVLAGVFGVLRDATGNIIQSELMVRTRAECAAAIAIAVAEGRGTDNGGCYLDLTANARGQAGQLFTAMMKQKVGGILKIVKGAQGVKAAKFEEPWEVKPSAHYCMGGVQATAAGCALDAAGSPIAGLLVAGQALGGLHGSNRLGSTSLAEGVIFGRRAGSEAAAQSARGVAIEWTVITSLEQTHLQNYLPQLGQQGEHFPIHLIRRLQASCWQGIGAARTGQGIAQVLSDVEHIEKQLGQATVANGLVWNQGLINYIECRNMLACASQIAMSAACRSESLGAHIRLDHTRNREFSGCYSLACAQDAAGELRVSRIDRPASPVAEKFRMGLRRNVKTAIIRLINSLPQRAQDKVLLKLYANMFGNSVSVEPQETAA